MEEHARENLLPVDNWLTGYGMKIKKILKKDLQNICSCDIILRYMPNRHSYLIWQSAEIFGSGQGFPVPMWKLM